MNHSQDVGKKAPGGRDADTLPNAFEIEDLNREILRTFNPNLDDYHVTGSQDTKLTRAAGKTLGKVKPLEKEKSPDYTRHHDWHIDESTNDPNFYSSNGLGFSYDDIINEYDMGYSKYKKGSHGSQ